MKPPEACKPVTKCCDKSDKDGEAHAALDGAKSSLEQRT